MVFVLQKLGRYDILNNLLEVEMKNKKNKNRLLEEAPSVSYRSDSVEIDPEELELLNDKDFIESLDRSEQEIKNGKTTKWKDFKWKL